MSDDKDAGGGELSVTISTKNDQLRVDCEARIWCEAPQGGVPPWVQQLAVDNPLRVELDEDLAVMLHHVVRETWAQQRRRNMQQALKAPAERGAPS